MDETSYCQFFFSLFSFFMEVEESFAQKMNNLETNSDFLDQMKVFYIDIKTLFKLI